MMAENLFWLKMLLLGLSAGLVYFGALWLSIRAFGRRYFVPHCYLTSLGLRLSLAVLLFVWLSRFGLKGLLFSLLGFVLARGLVLFKANWTVWKGVI